MNLPQLDGIMSGLYVYETTEERTDLINNCLTDLEYAQSEGLLDNAVRIDAFGPFTEDKILAPTHINLLVFVDNLQDEQKTPVTCSVTMLEFVELGDDGFPDRLPDLLLMYVDRYESAPVTIWRQGAE